MNFTNNHSSIISALSNAFFVPGLLQPEENQEPTTKTSRIYGYSVSTNQQTDSYIQTQLFQVDPAVSTKRKIHKCDQCDYSTDVKGTFKRHQMRHLPSDKRIKNLTCAKCTYRTDRKDLLVNHQKTHLSSDKRIKNFVCAKCTYRTDRKTLLVNHKKTHLSPDKRIKNLTCAKCTYRTDTKTLLVNHQKTHLSSDKRIKNLTCAKCTYRTDRKDLLVNHQKTHLSSGKRIKNFVCTQCFYRTDLKCNLTRHKKTHLFDELQLKEKMCKYIGCDFKTHCKSSLTKHQKRHLLTETNQADDIKFIKQEPACNALFGVKHRIDNRAPLWVAEPSIKQEFTAIEADKRERTYFAMADIPTDRKIRGEIKEAISFYKCLNDTDREQYLNERLFIQKHDGSIFSELKDQNETIANRDLVQWEILGHYAGKHYTEASYDKGENSMGTVLTNIDRYSFNTTPGQFISGFRSGNVTTLINACKTYRESEKEQDLPKKNVLYMRHTDEQGKSIIFVIALKDIKAGTRLWADYGEQYWKAISETIDIR